MPKNKSGYYTIGSVSKMCKVPIKTLRFYDSIELLVPSYRNDDSNYRYYTDEQIIRLHMIKKLKTFHFSLDEIKDILSRQRSVYLEERLESRLEVIRANIAEMEHLYYDGVFLLERIKNGNHILTHSDAQSVEDISSRQPGSILVKDMPPISVIRTRGIKKNYNNVNISVDRWLEIYDLAAVNKLKITGSVILTYHHKPFEQFYRKNCDLEVSLPVENSQDLPQHGIFGGFKAATALHIGSNSGIIGTHALLMQWIEQNGYQVCGPVSESYLISPLDVLTENENITEIIVPITK